MPRDMRARAISGQHNFMNRIANAFGDKGFKVKFRENTDEARLKSAQSKGYALFHMDPPLHDRALSMRLAYFYPFWRIEATEKRWEFTVADTRFIADEIESEQAQKFANFWRRRLFEREPERTSHQGYIYVPLQGRLLHHRSFQFCSPIEMIEATLEHNPAKRVVATLHPKEKYSKPELDALEALSDRHSRLEIQTGNMAQHLNDCAFVVTKNSSAALNGYFFRKPSVLFAHIDFHHIAANVHKLGIEESFRSVQEAAPEYDKYLFWFLKKMSINAGSDEAEEQILSMVRSHGWEV